jgi:ubiquinone/menaquinone biosynthesis C-methylase UbiE
MSKRDADDQMRAHFDRCAAEYDAWWRGTGSFASGERPGWSAEVEQLIGVVQALPPARTLDVACGTGFLTRHLRGELVALDQSARMVEIAATSLPHARVLQGDVAPLPFDDGEFDRVFTSLFLHHLPPDRRLAFIAEARRVGRELVVVEDVHGADTAAKGSPEQVLSDGSRRRMNRHSFTAAELISELDAVRVLHEGRWFLVVTAS